MISVNTPLVLQIAYSTVLFDAFPICISTRGGTIHIFVPNHHGTDLSVDDEALQRIQAIHPNPEGGTRSNATLFDNRQQNNSECRELRTWKQSALDSDHVLNASLT